MVGLGSSSLKWGRSPPSSPTPIPKGVPTAVLKAPVAEPASSSPAMVKVSNSKPCMEGVPGENGALLLLRPPQATCYSMDGMRLGGKAAGVSNGKKPVIELGVEIEHGRKVQGGDQGVTEGSVEKPVELVTLDSGRNSLRDGDPALTAVEQPVQGFGSTASGSVVPIMIDEAREGPCHEKVIGKLKVTLFTVAKVAEGGGV